MRFLVVAVVATFALTGCGSDPAAPESEPKPTTSSPEPESEEPETSPPSEEAEPAEPDVADLPNIALTPDGSRALTCKDWPNLSPDIKYGMVVNAMVGLELFPASPDRVNPAVKMVTRDCKGNDEVAYTVAQRAGIAVSS